MMNSKFSAIVLLATLMSACVSHSNIAPGGSVQLGPDEGLVIVGAPADSTVVFHSGEANDGKFVSDGWLPEGITGKAESGYFIRKLKATAPGRGYGMVMIKTDRWYKPSCTQSMVVLEVKAGQIQYYGDFFFDGQGASLAIYNKKDIQAATSRLNMILPNTSVTVKNGEMRLLKQGRCPPAGGATFIPVYISPRR